jgi:hypothetical protein
MNLGFPQRQPLSPLDVQIMAGEPVIPVDTMAVQQARIDGSLPPNIQTQDLQMQQGLPQPPQAAAPQVTAPEVLPLTPPAQPEVDAPIDPKYVKGLVAAIKQGGIQGGDEGAAQGFGQWMQKVASDDEAMGSIILALNSLRTKPDANLATAMREQISASRKQRKETATKNRTLEVLKGLPGVTDEIMKIAEVDPLAAIKMAIEKKKDRKIIEDVAGRQRYVDTGELTFPDIDVPAKQEAPATEAARTRLDQLIGKYGQEQGSAMFEREQQSHAIERARATVPPPPAAGNLGIEDLQSARTQVRTEFKQFDQPLEMIDQASVLANLAGAGTGEENSQAEAQLDKALAQVSGDRQTSMLEVNRLANTGNLAVRAGNVISKWLTGTQTEFTLNEKKQLLGELKEFHEARRKDHEGFLKDLYKQSNWPDDMVDKLFNQRQEFVGGSGWSTTSSGTKFKVVQ